MSCDLINYFLCLLEVIHKFAKETKMYSLCWEHCSYIYIAPFQKQQEMTWERGYCIGTTILILRNVACAM